MHVASLVCGLVDCKVFHLRSAEDDIGVRVLHGWNVFIWWSSRQEVSDTQIKRTTKKKEIRRKATEESTWVYALSDE